LIQIATRAVKTRAAVNVQVARIPADLAAGLKELIDTPDG